MSRSSSKRSKRRQLGEEVEKLGMLLSRLPMDELQKRLSESVAGGTVSELISAVDSGTQSLFRHAELGNSDAISFLRDCGCAIADLLCELTENTHPKVPLPEEVESSSPAGLSLSEVNQEIRESVDRLRDYGDDDQAAVSDSLRRMGSYGWFGGIDDLLGKDATHHKNPEGCCIAQEFEDWAGDIANSLISFRMRRHVSRIVRELACTSLHWPYSLDSVWEARRDLTEQYVAQLNLGMDLPFRLGSPKGGSRNRGSWSGSVTQFALELMVVLERHRNYQGPLDEDDEVWLKLAVLLPSFASGDSKVVDLWFNAGMALLESRCEGKWKEYHWPRCIFPRRATRVRTERELAATALKKGIRNLIKTPS